MKKRKTKEKTRTWANFHELAQLTPITRSPALAPAELHVPLLSCCGPLPTASAMWDRWVSLLRGPRSCEAARVWTPAGGPHAPCHCPVPTRPTAQTPSRRKLGKCLCHVGLGSTALLPNTNRTAGTSGHRNKLTHES